MTATAALMRARPATTALARYGARYTAALLMCDRLPLVKDADGIGGVAAETADQLETMGARERSTGASLGHARLAGVVRRRPLTEARQPEL